jgi:two-component system, NarL family, sensor histidine kinase UhpB
MLSYQLRHNSKHIKRIRVLSLKLRLILIINAVLLLILILGGVLAIDTAKKNVRAEVASSEKLALYLFDMGVLKNPKYYSIESEFKPLNLQSLVHMRHLKIEFFNLEGKLVDSNVSETHTIAIDQAPNWFVNFMGLFSEPWEPKRLIVDILGQPKGAIVITPDPSYEFGEIWNQFTGVFYLAGAFFVLTNILVAWIVFRALSPVEFILKALTELELGNLKVKMPYLKTSELSAISSKFNHMVKTLRLSIEQNHELSRKLIRIQEEERKSLARDLHDEFGQSLTAIHADAAVLKALANKDYPKIKPSVHAISDLSKHLMNLVGGMLSRLKVGVLHELGLEEGLKDLLNTWQLRHPKINLHYQINLKALPKINETVSITSYRIIQECLTNISRHAKAKHVEIEIQLIKKNASSKMIDIHVKDDGIGLSKSHRDGFGLSGMRERIHEVNGIIKIVSEVNQGVSLHIQLPLKRI